MNCPSCSAEIGETSKFCSACGCALSDDVAVTTAYHAKNNGRGVDTQSSSSGSHHHGRFLPGSRIADRYRIVSLVGKGGMGEVYRADDLTLGQTVALKFLPQDFCNDPHRLEYFHSEVRLSRQVSHPNVCRVYDIGEIDGQHFLSMEYVDGEDLAALIRRIGRLPSDKGVDIARQLCAGLAAAHDKGVLHRDLKPANVMLDDRGHVRITDFGLARLVDEAVGRGVQAGTPAYMAPEQAAGREVTVRSDLYSLGLLLYEMFTGHSWAPVREGSTLPVPSSAVPEIDGSVERVILRCLEEEPSRRPSSALAIAAGLPGGDPLAAALAAGDTPSPQMVAAAGGETGLSVMAAVACLLAVVLCLPLACLLAQTTALVNRVELSTPSRLRDTAREWVEKHLAIPPEDSFDEADGFSVTRDRVAPIRYWYRRRYSPLVPNQSAGVEVALQRGFGQVGLLSPPLEDPEEISLELDGGGQLIRFQKVPPARFVSPADSAESAAAAEGVPLAAWESWFPEERVGFRFRDLASLPVAGLPIPRHPYDEVRAWKREAEEDEQQQQYVLAAVFQGQPIHFEVGPWPAEEKPPEGPNFFGALLLTLLPFVAVLSLRNYRSGRVDRRTVVRVASIIFLLGMLVYVLSAHHQFGVAELNLLTLALGTSAFLALYFSVWYSALEPLVRRIWPETLITWTRLFSGQIPDALVGRDLLIGTLFGLFHLLIAQFGRAIPIWMGHDDIVRELFMTESLYGVRGSLSSVLQLQLEAFWICSFCLTLLMLLRQVLRKEMLAIVAVGLIDVLGLVVFPSAHLPVATWFPYAIAIGVAWSLHALVIVRFGFLAFFVAWMTVAVLLFLPLTTELVEPRIDGALIALGLVVCVALLGFDMTLGGRLHRAVVAWIRGG